MQYIKLRNGNHMPKIMMGTSICDLRGEKKALSKMLEDSVIYAESLKAIGFDTARDYHNEALLGDIFGHMFSSGVCRREDIFITTKVGNSQQRGKNMYKEIDQSLKDLRLDYIDLWLLHWPLPDYWLDNWQQIVDIYKSGKVKSIGIANCRERHINMLIKEKLDMPHVIQVEYHPFRTIPELRRICNEKQIQLEAYSANCLMLPFVKNNETLLRIASAHNKSVTQIIMRWHVQQGVVPIFRSFNHSHIKDNVEIFDYMLSEKDMQDIFDLNSNYKFHPESVNCPGY